MPRRKKQADEANDRGDFVAGRAHGAVTVLLAFAATHPDPEHLLSELERVEQAALAQVESSLRSDLYLDGMRDVIDRRARAATSAAGTLTGSM